MQLSKELSDDSILSEIGSRLSRRRLDLGMTQAVLAREAGVSKSTVERVEAGCSVQLSSLIRLMRQLDLVSGLEDTFSSPEPSPLELLKQRGRVRKRGYAPRARKAEGNAVSEGEASPPSSGRAKGWTWGDDQ